MCWCVYKNPIKYHVYEKDCTWNLILCASKIDEYLKSVIGDSINFCDDIIDVVATSHD